MTSISSFTDLKAWQESHKLVIFIYKITNEFPTSEQFGLTNQLRRASVSISSNIAEGFSRKSAKEKSQFYSMGLSSLTEVQNQILVARDIEYISKDQFNQAAELTVTISKLITGLIKTVQNRPLIRNT